MTITDRALSTGLPSFDHVIRGLLPGDNVVWQVDAGDSYAAFVRPFYESALRSGRTVVYFRFASHPALVPNDSGIEVHAFRPEDGFEEFIDQVHTVIEKAGRGAFYVFDCLSELAGNWYSDQMLANFFMLTCPYLYDLETVAYFALLKDHHSLYATQPIEQTTQILLDAYRHKGKIYVHPLKVQQRLSPTMYTLHAWEGDAFRPVTESYIISEILSELPWSAIDSGRPRLGIWHRTSQDAENLLTQIERGEKDPVCGEEFKDYLLHMTISRDERVLALARRYFTLRDVVQIRRRMTGSGLIGGKSTGMLLARAILKHHDPRWEHVLEPHDSFFIGSDVFYTYLVRNHCWWAHEKQKESPTILEETEKARQRILRGTFPDHIVRQFVDLLEYFGQSPIIVRSSSLLEDNFGNAFAGKYESVFCPNQGPRDRCLEDFLTAVRAIYASTMSEKAISYRAERGLLDRDEQMALLIQRVSGEMHRRLFFPQIAGVGFSFNPYAWDPAIDPEAGVVRLVFGLGTRAVDRSDDDYTRLVSLSAPEKRPEADMADVRRYTQRRVDALDLDANRLLSKDFEEVARESETIPLSLFASRDEEMERRAREANLRNIFPWVLTFDDLLTKTGFVADMKEILRTVHTAYESPVDMEFATNFMPDGSYRINVLQCRPLQLKGGGSIFPAPKEIPADQVVLEARGAVIGQSRVSRIERLIYVSPAYGELPDNTRYSVARAIGRIVRTPHPAEAPSVFLIGPGRWGTTTPSLGVPVSFAEISRTAAVCEVVAMREDLVPDVSLGTHFFSDLVEMDILYLALFPNREGNTLNADFLENAPNSLDEVLPEATHLSHVLRVIDAANLPGGPRLWLHANALKQRVLCYLEPATT
jgi:pyruvate, water dikinase